ncbi:MAG TPA: mandelate racemase/muconate lactonizing enzyme family protein [Burkholderiaceae bacterium]|jgi:L-alanine-DL-glutamate epimerase-like enolase superfamily enzyme|nr:mandelate racemase/muconate lactonizing enzyme family protein [Burkholderiaceae bacterium]
MSNQDNGLKIVQVEAFPTSFPVRQGVTLGIGRAVKRDCVIVKVTTENGLVGWGEAHHGRCPGAIGQLINTTLRQLVTGMNAYDVVGVWARIYSRQLASHGMGTAAALAMSGLDLALWDIRGKAVGWPLYKLLGGASKAIPAYAGGISLGFQSPKELVDEARLLVEQGYRTLKLRFGDTVGRDIERLAAIRAAFGDEVGIMVDANTGYSVDDVRRVMPALVAQGVLWLEEPFPPQDYRSYEAAHGFGGIPLAAGENHFTRYEFNRMIEEKSIRILQPDLSKTGGITEVLRIAAMASAYKLSINPHTSASGINMAASIHLLASIENGGYFEADVARENLFRDQLTSRPDLLDKDGCVRPPEAPGLGVEVDEDFLKLHPVIEGPAYV